MSNNLKKGLKRIWWVFPAIYFVLGIVFFHALRGDNYFFSGTEWANINWDNVTKFWAIFLAGLVIILFLMRNWAKEEESPILDEDFKKKNPALYKQALRAREEELRKESTEDKPPIIEDKE